MPRTAAQKAARKRRRQAKAGKGPAHTVPKYNKGKRGPIFRNPQPVANRQARPQQRKSGGKKHKGIIGQIYPFPYREECLGPVSTAVNFAIQQSLVLNAGNSVTFPWLGSIAPKFEYYRFKKLALRFESSSGYSVASTNTALGTMLVNANYDILDPAFASQIEMEAYGGGKLVTEKEPNITFTHRIEENGIRGGVAGGWRYVLPSTATTAAGQPYPASSSAHDYDIGLLQIASAGAQAASVAGRVFMCYEVEFANPKLVPGAPVGAVAHFSSIAATTANNFASAALQSGATLGGVTLGTNTIVFPANVPGNYKIDINIMGATSATGFSVSSVGTGTALNFYSQSAVRDSVSQVFSGNGVTTNPAMLATTLTVPAAGCTVTLNASTITGTGTMDLWITALPSSVLSVDEKEQVEIDELRDEVSEMRAMLKTLCGNSTRSFNVASDGSCSSMSAKSAIAVQEPMTPDDSTEMEQSIHISKEMVMKLLGK